MRWAYWRMSFNHIPIRFKRLLYCIYASIKKRVWIRPIDVYVWKHRNGGLIKLTTSDGKVFWKTPSRNDCNEFDTD